MNNKNIMIVAELDNGKVDKSALELMTKARDLFPAEDVRVAYVTTGENISSAVDKLKTMGADVVYAADDDRLEQFNIDYVSAAVLDAVRQFEPDIMLVPATTYGEELAPTLALKLKTAGAAHCVDLKVRENGEFVTMVPAFGGKVIGEILIPNTRPQIASVKPGMFEAKEQKARNCEVVMIDPAIVQNCKSRIRAIGQVEKEPEGIPVEKAEVIVCGGYGVGSQENWNKLEELAKKLGGTTGCTRPVVDEGWVPDASKMIGTSGKGTRPKFYIGFGISGAAHHVCGMQDSGCIVTVNTDKEAPMVTASDYVAVADNMDVVNALLSKI